MNEENVIIYVSQDKNALETNYKSGYPLLPTSPKQEKLSDLHSDDSGRSWIDGVMDLNILRENVYSVELSFEDIGYEIFTAILSALKNKEDGGFYASIFNYEKGVREIMHMYRSDRDFAVKHYIGGWRADLTVSLVQL